MNVQLLFNKLIRFTLLCAVLCIGAGSASAQDDGVFTLNLNNVDINALITTVAKKTGKNFVVDPRVNAKVTVISNQEMNSDDLYQVFLSVLQVHGYSAVPSGDVIKILPDVNAKQGSVPLVSGSSRLGDQLVTRVVPIKNVTASQLVPILRPLVPQQGHLAAYSASNIIVITDRARNINRLVNIISKIDRPDNSEIEFVRIEHANAKEVVRILQSLQSNANKNRNMPGQTQLAADDRTNSVLISGSRANRARLRALIASLDTPSDGGGNTKVIYLKYAKAKELVNVLKGVEKGQANTNQANPNSPGGASAGVDIQADEETNALVITAAPDAMKSIEAVIRKLDIRRAQVHVEAIIAELTDDTAREIGFSYVAGNKDIKGAQRPIGAIGLGGGSTVLGEIAGVATGASKNASSITNGFNVLFGKQSGNGNVFGGIMRAIASDGSNNILSTPSIVTLDNEEAEIVVGQNVPFVTGSYTSSNNGANNPFQTVERKDVGIKLKIKPQINEGDTIQLKIEQEVSSVSNDSQTGQLITDKRNINTNVLVEDGQLLVLGGLIDDQKSKGVSKVPLLGDIPLLGRLFQYRTNNGRKRNLMVFLHPKIIRDRAVADATSQEKYLYMRAKQLEAQSPRRVFSDDDLVLPEVNMFFAPDMVYKPSTPAVTVQPKARIEYTPTTVEIDATQDWVEPLNNQGVVVETIDFTQDQ